MSRNPELVKAKVELLTLLREKPGLLEKISPDDQSAPAVIEALAEMGDNIEKMLAENGMNKAQLNRVVIALPLAVECIQEKSVDSGLRCWHALTGAAFAAVLGLTGYGIKHEVENEWRPGACQILTFHNDCSDCEFLLNVEDKTTGSELSLPGYKLDFEYHYRWSRYIVKGEPFRCCPSNLNCCDFVNRETDMYCDNWPQRTDQGGEPCPQNFPWPCSFIQRDATLDGDVPKIIDLRPYIDYTGRDCFAAAGALFIGTCLSLLARKDVRTRLLASILTSWQQTKKRVKEYRGLIKASRRASRSSVRSKRGSVSSQKSFVEEKKEKEDEKDLQSVSEETEVSDAMPRGPPLPRDRPPAHAHLRPIITPLKGSMYAEPMEFAKRPSELYGTGTSGFTRRSSSQPSRKRAWMEESLGTESPKSGRFSPESPESPSKRSLGSPSSRSISPSQRNRGMQSPQSLRSMSWQDICAQMDRPPSEDPAGLRLAMSGFRASTPPNAGKTHLTGYRGWIRPQRPNSSSPTRHSAPGRQGPRAAAGGKELKGTIVDQWPSPM